jgi:hypothetical protein
MPGRAKPTLDFSQPTWTKTPEESADAADTALVPDTQSPNSTQTPSRTPTEELFVVTQPVAATTTPVPTNRLESNPEDLFSDLNCSSQTTTPCSYTVKAGDSFSRISNSVYGSPEYTPMVMSLNRDKYGMRSALYPGQTIYLPPAGISQEQINTSLYVECGKDEYPCWYRVQPYDGYESISRDIYGYVSYSGLIEKANWDYVNNPDTRRRELGTPALVPGMVIVVPVR